MADPRCDRSVDTDRLGHLRAARDLIDGHYAEPLDLAVLAARAGYSRYHFARSFQQVYGETPGRHLTRRRVERARELLRSANLTVTEVCHLVGFSSLGSFSRRFREVVGESPSAYRARVVANGGPPPVPGCFVLMWGTAAPAAPVVRNRGEARPPTAGLRSQPSATRGAPT